MNCDRHAGACDQVGECNQVILVCMHAARRREPHQMADPAALPQGRDHVRQQRIARQRSVREGGVDPRQVRHRDAPGAEVHVADFGVAHLPLRQADEALRRIDQTLRASRDQAIEVRRAGIEDGIVPGIGTEPPAVENAEDGRPGRCGRHQEALPPFGRLYSTALNLLGQLRSRGSVLGFWSGTSIAQNTNSPRDSPSMVMS